MTALSVSQRRLSLNCNIRRINCSLTALYDLTEMLKLFITLTGMTLISYQIMRCNLVNLSNYTKQLHVYCIDYRVIPHNQFY
jgi:hypothetical protein